MEKIVSHPIAEMTLEDIGGLRTFLQTTAKLGGRVRPDTELQSLARLLHAEVHLMRTAAPPIFWDDIVKALRLAGVRMKDGSPINSNSFRNAYEGLYPGAKQVKARLKAKKPDPANKP